jgi:hypothetical protein
MNMAADRKRGRPKGTGINDHEMLLKIAALLAADPAKKRTTAIKEIGVTNASVVRRLRDKYQAEEAQLMAEMKANTAAPVAAAKTSRKAAAAHVAPVAAPAVAAVAAPVVNGHAAASVAKTEPVAAKTSKKGKATAAVAQTEVHAAAVETQAHAVEHVHVEPIATAHQTATPQVAAAPAAAAQPAPAAATASATAPKAKPAVDPLAALFEGLNIETLVTQFIGHALGLSAAEIKNSPIPALIRQQAQLADLVLPLLASQFLGQKSSSKAA